MKPKITRTFKKKILKDWNAHFPNLIAKPPLSLKRRVGPLLISIGFDLKMGREEYYPGFGVHNLSREIDFLTSILDTNLRTIRTRAQDWITVRGHEKGLYHEAAERMRNQCRLPMESPITLDMIIDAYKVYVRDVDSDPVDLFEDPALISAWAGQKQKAKEALEWGYSEISLWKSEWLEEYGGLEGWLKSMEERISDPEKLRKIEQEQAVFHKVDHIPMEELIID